MKAVQFESSMTQNGQIGLPPEVVGEIPAGEHLSVVVMWEPTGLESEWRSAGHRNFEAAYCSEDAVYEQLIDDAATR